MMNKDKALGHFFAVFSILVWGVTFVSSKILLSYYTPLAIMVFRFTIAYVGLWILHPKKVKDRTIKGELVFAIAGMTGVSGYFFLENSALIYTTASNTGLILSAAPLFVAIVTHIFTRDEHFHRWLLVGFLLSMVGIALIIFNGKVHLEVNPIGDFMALMAGLIWAFYSLALKKMPKGLSPFLVTRRTFFYGIIFGGIPLLLTEGSIDFHPLLSTSAGLHILFLGIVASGTCYVFWNEAMRRIGAIKASNYIYLIPAVTMLSAWIFLKETVNGLMIIGCIIILCGVYLAERGDKLMKVFVRG